MKIKGYEVNFTEEELDKILADKTRSIELISREFEGYKKLSIGDKKAIDHLQRAADIINDVALEQDNPHNLSIKYELEKLAVNDEYAAKILQLFNCLNGVAGNNGIDRDPVQIFQGLPLLKGKNFYPVDLSIEEFHEIILRMAERGKFEELQKILSARTMVRRNGDELKAIDYTEYFAQQFSEIANELEVAAYYCTEPEFKEFLSWQAQALLQNNQDMDMLADKHWAVLQNNNLEFTISRENYEDEMTGTVFNNPDIVKIINDNHIEVVAKDTLGGRVGLVNKEGTENILKFKQTLPYLSQWMPLSNQYKQNSFSDNDLKQTMVDVDLITLTGDYAMCRGGITQAQNLPNNDKIAVKCGGWHRNVYHRQVLLSYDVEHEKKLLNRLVDAELHKYVDHAQIITFDIGHENGHSLGPTAEYQNALGVYKHIIEEHKANIFSIASMAELAKKEGRFNKEDLKKIYASWVVETLFLRARPLFSEPHRMASLIEFNYLFENKVIWFDSNKKLHIDFDLIGMVAYRLLEETIKVQLSKSAENAKAFIDRWSAWGEWSHYITDVQQELGAKPYIKIITNF